MKSHCSTVSKGSAHTRDAVHYGGQASIKTLHRQDRQVFRAETVCHVKEEAPPLKLIFKMSYLSTQSRKKDTGRSSIVNTTLKFKGTNTRFLFGDGEKKKKKDRGKLLLDSMGYLRSILCIPLMNVTWSYNVAIPLDLS